MCLGWQIENDGHFGHFRHRVTVLASCRFPRVERGPGVNRSKE